MIEPKRYDRFKGKEYLATGWVKYPISIKFKTDATPYVETAEEGKKILTEAWNKNKIKIKNNEGELCDFQVEYNE